MRLFTSKAAAAVLFTFGLAACAREGDIQQAGILTSYTACPPVAVVAPAGDVTLFDPASSRDSAAIDVVANITNVRSTCTGTEVGENIITEVTFDIQARRRDNRGARSVTLPYFATIVQGNGNVVAKRVRQLTLTFADGAYRTNAPAAASSRVICRRISSGKVAAERSTREVAAPAVLVR